MKAHDELEVIWEQVPVDYYQKGTQNNILQRLWHRGKLKSVRLLIAYSKIDPKKILDVGCASGWFLSQLSHFYPKAKCYGIDVYKEAITYGKKRYKSLDLRYADGHSLPYANKSFDVVVCTEVLEHVVDPEKVLREIRRVLSPNGVAVIEMDTGNRVFQLIWYWWTHMRHGVWEHAHIQVFNSKKLEVLIKKAGFTIIKKKTFNYSMAIAFLVNRNEG